jgi:hypothetical protein
LENTSDPEASLPGCLFIFPYILAIQNDLSGGGLQQTVQMLNQSGFTRSGMTDNADKFPSVYGKGHAIKRRMLKWRTGAVNMGKIFNFQNR